MKVSQVNAAQELPRAEGIAAVPSWPQLLQKTPCNFFFCNTVEEFAGPGKLGSEKFCRTFLQQAFYYVRGSAEPSCRTPKVQQNSGEPLGAQTRLLRTGFFSSQQNCLQLLQEVLQQKIFFVMLLPRLCPPFAGERAKDFAL